MRFSHIILGTVSQTYTYKIQHFVYNTFLARKSVILVLKIKLLTVFSKNVFSIIHISKQYNQFQPRLATSFSIVSIPITTTIHIFLPLSYQIISYSTEKILNDCRYRTWLKTQVCWTSRITLQSTGWDIWSLISSFWSKGPVFTTYVMCLTNIAVTLQYLIVAQLKQARKVSHSKKIVWIKKELLG